jgi:hypothetical protein
MKKLTIIILGVIIISCNSKKEAPITSIIKVSPSYINNQTEDYEKFIKKVTFIPLETDPQCLISKIDQLYIGSDGIFVLDGMQKDIFRFSLDGKFINRIGTTGRGPGEFLNPVHFVVNEKQNVILINDRRQMKILKYSLDGKFIDEIRTNIYFTLFLTAGNNEYWIYMINEEFNNDEKPTLNFLKINKNGKVIDKIYGVNYIPLAWCDGTKLSDHQAGPQSSFVLSLNENIYSFEDGEIRIKYKIDFQKANLSDDKLKMFSNKFEGRRKNLEMAEKLWTKSARGYHHFIETEQWIYFMYSLNGKGSIVLYNKVTNNTIDMPKLVYNENGWETFFQCQFAKGNLLYSIIHPLTLRNLFDNEKNRYSNNRLRSFSKTFQNIKDDDNPIIICYELKD